MLPCFHKPVLSDWQYFDTLQKYAIYRISYKQKAPHVAYIVTAKHCVAFSIRGRIVHCTSSVRMSRFGL